MSVVPKSINLSIQRSVKVGEYQYNKVELGMVINVKDEQPRDVIDKLYSYIDLQINKLLKAELINAERDKQAVADEIPF